MTVKNTKKVSGITFGSRIHFLKFRWVSLSFSGVIILAGIVFYILHGGFKLGIDFVGGTRIEVQIKQAEANVSTVRELFIKSGIESEITTLGAIEDKIFLVTVPGDKHSTIKDVNLIEKILTTKFGSTNVKIRGSELIGPKMGKTFATRSIQLLIIVAVLILAYVAIRFDFFYGTGAIAALFHDLLIMSTFSVFFGIRVDIPVIAAFLTILGYSINDTIVVFDRVRENHSLAPEEDYEMIMDKSITQSLSRTIITSLTTFLITLAIFIWGGRVLHNFGLELMIGIISGTYSSIFIASPVTFFLKTRFDKKTVLTKKRLVHQ